uniref:G_PROTEIN_RECEP_F1_2 domain-containing protein n=1 Tax=Macrostomum lignano TaxID=282301 RepID=A0A1I8GFF1_9PLAT
MGTPLYMVSLAFLIIANVMSLFQNSNRIFFPFINAILLIFSSLLLSMGCIYFIGAVDFEGLNDHPEEKYRPVSYEFGYCFKLVWLSFLLENLAIAVNVYLWMSYRSEDLKHQRENIASFKNIAMQ